VARQTPIPIGISTMICIASAAHGHLMEHPTNVAKAVSWRPDRLAYLPVDRVPRPTANFAHPGLEYVVVLPNRWAQIQNIHVCFVGGPPDLRLKILDISRTWFKHINLKLAPGSEQGIDCNHNDGSEVRIGFSEPGYWSYMGNNSLSTELVSKDLESMNFEGFDQNPPAEPRFTGIILHEWGHDSVGRRQG
jgi:hypothetical protein